MRFPSSISALLVVLALSHCQPPSESPAAGSHPGEPAAAPPDEPSLPETVTFNEHIQPILSEYCYHCHGPDEETRYPEDEPLRLDLAEFAFAPRESGKPVILKGDPTNSLLVKRVHSDDPDSVMPPPESHKKLDARHVALLEKWIADGAEYQDHWSFIPIERPELPGAGREWAANPIDRFVAARLEAAGLEPNPPEEAARLHRRLSLDLTGLPPTPEETEAFLEASAVDTEAALDAEADRLLASPASAEHLARHWLDAARYADTHGIHIDNYRAIWPYRDWVIRAFQRNMPWDEFTLEQIAGDLLPDASLDQKVATGFGRCLPTTGEGGAIGEEYLAIYAKDRVDTTAAIWLGLTTGCASCHDHKFDPISMREFYSLAAFFRNTPMSALDGNNANHPPNLFVPLPGDRQRFRDVAAEIAATTLKITERRKAAQPEFESWLATATIEAPREIDSTLHLHLPLTEADGPLRGLVDGEPREWTAELPRIEAPLGQAPVVSHQPVELGDLASFSRPDQVSYGGFIRIEGKPTGAVVARMDPSKSFRGWDLYLQQGRPASHVIDSWDKAANKVVAHQPLPPNEWHHVMVTFDGTTSGHQAHAIYVDGKQVGSGIDPNTVGGTIETGVPLRLGSRHNNDSKLNGKVALQDFRFYRRLLGAEEIEQLAGNALLRHIASLPVDQRSPQQVDTLFGYFLSNHDAATRELNLQLDRLKTEQEKLRARGSISLVMKEKKEEPFAHVLRRGVYSDKGDRVTPGTPAILPPMPADAPRNRLGLARWLNDPANPLPARVTMNRAWYYLFGSGIVETTEDFGVMGARPSHPQLLDWLAAEFIGSDWDFRHMLKLMVTSATYRQSAAVPPEKLEADPLNRLLSRGPRYRLDAEQIRDLALAASGLLVDRVGGPPVKPYQPEGIWEAVAMPQSNTRNYRPDSGQSLYRRSIYTFWKRTAPHPAMEILNAPTREVFCVRRERTNTPLQAFVTLNDPQFVEACRRLAEHALRHSDDAEARVDFLTRRLVSRTLAGEERPLVHATLGTALAAYRSDPESAGAFIRTGASAPDAALDPAELAAWTLVASQLLNLDETLNK